MTWTRDEAIITRIDDWIRKSDSRAKENNVDSKNLKRRRKELVSYLRENQIPVTDAGDWVGSQPPISLLSGQVVIHPPYTSRSILSDNQIVAKRVRGILGRFYSESISQPKARATGILPVDVLSSDKVATPGKDGYVVFD
uniref:AD domain-containing protein n=1 Tax=Amorphochlora amoebiformis TaxID=1561963 RepID=A0A6T6TIV8_9EUKA|mmetsp:Transcript_19461/g.30913  ORF Transcript_19461/g.30913 Transcript_19461/m.30913 type:complete len:140 (+) Transcript_19461:395-814(+)